MLTRRMQVRAVADLLDGMETGLVWESFAEPWREAYRTLFSLDGDKQEGIQALTRVLAREELGEVLALASTPITFPSLQELAETLPPIEWLWEGWIPRGMITLLGGAPGAGKSFVAQDLCRRMIHEGLSFPDGTPIPQAGGNVIYVDAEAVPQLINERAERWQMDRARMYLMLPAEDRLYIDFTEDLDRDHLVEMAYELAPVLIVVDSLSSISSRGENSVEDVRDVLGFLNLVVQEIQCGLVLNHHLRKQTAVAVNGQLTLDDFRGSSHIGAISRSVMGLSVVQTGPEIDRNGPRRLEVVKTNLGAYPPPIGVEFVPRGGGVMLKYGEAPEAYQEPTRTQVCAEWLVQVLEEAGEPVAPKDLIEMGEEKGFNRRMIYRAREELGGELVNTGGRRSPQNKWALVGWDDNEKS